MEPYLLDWLALLVRWMHLIFGIAWIGASFYFVWLDNHLVEPTDEALREKGIGGELWAIHGGGFYNAQKYRVAPGALPPHLHWFYWEAYSTWLSGFLLLCLMYYLGADVYLIDKNVLDINQPEAVAIGLGTLIIGWIAYDRLCASPLARNGGALAPVLAVLLIGAAWGLCHVFSGRGAYLHFGAMLGTIMVANVFFVVIPSQRELVAAKTAGRPPDPMHGARAKQRSVHNTYITLPVLFTMISNHYAMTYGSRWNWLALLALTFAGVAVRTYFVARHKAGSDASLLPLLAGTAAFALAVILVRPHPELTSQALASTAMSGDTPLAHAQAIVHQRCVPCHSPAPTQPGFAAAPNGVMLDTPERMIAQRDKMHTQLVSRAMPIGNLTGMTDDERASLIEWTGHATPP